MRSPNPSPTPRSFNLIDCALVNIPGIGEEHAAQSPEERCAQLGIPDQELRASERRFEK